MGGNYSHTTRADGTTLTGTIYNGDHVNHITNLTPAGNDDYQATLSEKQTQTNPSSGLATALAGDLAQIRFILNKLGAGTTFWYEVGGPAFWIPLTDKAVAVVGTKKDGMIVPYAGTIYKAIAYSDVTPTGADLTFDINKNGTTIFTTQSNRVKVVAGSNAGSSPVIENGIFAEGDRIDLDIDVIGSGVAGGNWSRVAVLVKPLVP